MPYLDESGLAYYNEKLQPWIASQPVKTLPSTLYPWTLTDKAGAVTCWPVGGTPLLPTVDFLFAETGPAEGDKAPDNPSTITGVSSVEVTRCGKNLFDFRNYPSITKNDVTLSSDSDGIITIDGTASAYSQFIVYLPAEKQFTIPSGAILSCKNTLISGTATPASGSSALKTQFVGTYSNGNHFYPGGSDFEAEQYTAAYDVRVTRVAVVISAGASFTNAKIQAQIELGSTATSFEPYEGSSYTIPLGGTYYGGSVDLASGEMTVTHAVVVLDGTESWLGTSFTNTTRFGCIGFAVPKTSGDQICSHFQYYNNYSQDSVHFYVGPSGSVYIFYPDAAMTASEFNEWLAAQNSNGTPVTICYELATPTTSQLTPTQILSLSQSDKYTPRLNTVYSDATSVQVGYVKSPIREELELTQAIVAQGGNI